MSVEKLVVQNVRKGTGVIIAFADIDFGGWVTVLGCKLVEGKKGRFVGMPSRQSKDASGETIWAPQAVVPRDMEPHLLEDFEQAARDKGFL